MDQPRSIRPVAVVVDPEELYALGLERRLYEVVRAFNELDVGQSLYLEPWAAQGFIDLGLIREVPDGQDQDPNRA